MMMMMRRIIVTTATTKNIDNGVRLMIKEIMEKIKCRTDCMHY